MRHDHMHASVRTTARGLRAGLSVAGMVALAGVSGVAEAAGSDGASMAALVHEAGARVVYGSSVAADGDAGAQAGKDAKGFYWGAGDSRLYFGGNMQFRSYANFRDDAGLDNDLTSGFGFRRVRLSAQGKLTKELGFRIDGDFLSGDSLKLFEAFATYAADANWTFTLGQFKPPLLREELHSFLTLQAVDRSTVNSVFTQNYSQGLMVTYAGDDVRAFASLNDGLNRLNTDFDSTNESDYGLTGRVEWKWAGEWKQYDSTSSWRGSQYFGVLGGAVHYESGGETNNTPDQEKFQYTLDAAVKGDGWNAYAQFVGRNIDTPGSSFDDFGFIVQGGYFVHETWEPFVRWSHVIPDDSRPNGEQFKELTFGVNHFLIPSSHAAKLTLDATYCFDAQNQAGSIVPVKAVDGLLASTEDGQVYIRAQFQLVF